MATATVTNAGKPASLRGALLLAKRTGAIWRAVPEEIAVGKTKARPEGDVSVGLDRLDSLPEVEHVSLKQLTVRVCMLLALVTGQRGHAFHFLKVEDITLKVSKFTILYSAVSYTHLTLPTMSPV